MSWFKATGSHSSPKIPLFTSPLAGEICEPAVSWENMFLKEAHLDFLCSDILLLGLVHRIIVESYSEGMGKGADLFG